MSQENNKFTITSHNQSGGITAHTVNVAPPTRQMNEELGSELKSRIPKDASLTINSVFGDSEALGFAHQVLSWCRVNGYSKVEGVSQSMYSHPILGQVIDQTSANSFKIIIGTRQ